jgi:glycosyltransferase involved in cell wall biosynthesis
VTSPPISIVIPALNAAQTIEQQLAAIAAQDYDGAIEVIVADNGSQDDTGERARRWGNQIAVHVVSVTGRQSAARARNAGIREATSSLILGCDADDIVDEAWVRLLARELEECDVVAGGMVDWDGGGFPEDPRPTAFGRGGFGFLPALVGCNYGLRREVWEALRGFDEQLGVCDDVDVAWRAQLAGYRLRSVPEGFVYYRVPQRSAEVFRKWVRYSVHQPALYRRFRSQGLARQSPYRAVGRLAVLVLTSYRLLGSATVRVGWCQEMGRRTGRAIGSLRYHTVFL